MLSIVSTKPTELNTVEISNHYTPFVLSSYAAVSPFFGESVRKILQVSHSLFIGWNNPWQDCVRRSSVCHSDIDRLSEDGPTSTRLVVIFKTGCLVIWCHLAINPPVYSTNLLSEGSTKSINQSAKTCKVKSLGLHAFFQGFESFQESQSQQNGSRRVTNGLRFVENCVQHAFRYADHDALLCFLFGWANRELLTWYIGFVSSIHSTILLCLTHAFPFGQATTWSEEEEKTRYHLKSLVVSTGTCS